MIAKKIEVIIKADDNKVYQVITSEIEKKLISELLKNMAKDGVIEILDKPIENIDIVLNENPDPQGNLP